MRLTPDAIYFDYKRRNDPEFRKALKRDKKKHARAQKQQADAASAQQRDQIAAALRQVAMEGFPEDVEEKEHFFMNEVAQGEGLCQEGTFTLEGIVGNSAIPNTGHSCRPIE